MYIYEYGKDTTGYADFTAYGTGIDTNTNYVSKVRPLWGYKFFGRMTKHLIK